MSIMQEQKMIDESLLLRYFEKEVNEEEKKKVEEWIHSSEANSRMAKQVARIFVLETQSCQSYSNNDHTPHKSLPFSALGNFRYFCNKQPSHR